MNLDPRLLLSRSFTFAERIALLREGDAQLATSDETSRAIANRRLELLKRRLTMEDGHCLLVPRVVRDNIPISAALDALSPTFRYLGPEPAWVSWFLLGADRLAAGSNLGSDTAIPFDALLDGFVFSALHYLTSIDQRRLWPDLRDSAQGSLARVLRRRLSGILQWCYYQEFCDHRESRDGRNGAFDSFVVSAQRPEWGSYFFAKYAGNARLVGTTLMSWAENAVLLLGRFEADREALCHFLGTPQGLSIEQFEGFSSDPHAGGQSVAFLHLNTGQRVVYKPTDAKLAELWTLASARCFGDQGFGDQGFGDQGLGEPDGARPPLVRPGYGWHRFLADRASGSEELNAGSLAASLGRQLALASVLGATDMHFENFMEVAGQLVLIDHETVLSPGIDLAGVPGSQAQKLALAAITDSVLATGALPQWSLGPGGALWNADAFGWQEEDPSKTGFPFIVNPNSDDMTVSHDLSRRPGVFATNQRANLVRENAAETTAEAFRSAWRSVSAKREQLAQLLEECQSAQVRVILRATREYSELLGQGAMPPYCHDLVDRSLLFERLRRSLHLVPATDPRWNLVEDEIRALIRGDIPAFHTPGGQLYVREALGKASVKLKGTPPVKRALRNLGRLQSQNKRRDDELIVSSIQASQWPAVAVWQGCLPNGKNDRTHANVRHAAAARIFDTLHRRSYESSRDGSIALIAAARNLSGRTQHLTVVDPADTVSGPAGLGLLAAALNRIRPAGEYREVAQRVADTLCVALDGLASPARPSPASAQGVGAFSGLPSVAYCLWLLGETLDEQGYSGLARSWYLTWGSRLAAFPEDCGVISGAAGLCMVGGVLAGGDLRADAAVAGVVEPALRAIQERAVLTADRTYLWPSDPHNGRSGFARGAAGIGAALARLALHDDRGLHPLVCGAMNSELHGLDPGSDRWRHGEAPDASAASWCCGGAGMLLASQEFQGAGVADSGALADKAIDALLTKGPQPDGLCHGLGGSSAVLWEHGRLVGDRRLVAFASYNLDEVARRCLSGPGIGLEPTSSPVHSAGLMCGSAGVGLALLSPETGDIAARLLSVRPL